MLEVKDIIALDNKGRYIVMAKTEIDGNWYYYLLDMDKHTNHKFCMLDSDSMLVEVTNRETMQMLIKRFATELRKEIKKGE